MNAYVPDHGDIAWLNFDPHLGREQAGRRPALILSHSYYHRRAGLLVCCPITFKIKGYPFEVLLPGGLQISGAILCDQIRCMDYLVRDLGFICTAPHDIVVDVLAKIDSHIGSIHP